MGNRAVITTKEKKIGIYLHWNGGRDSVEAFLTYCNIKGYRDLTSDKTYGMARLVQVIANFFGGSTSIGIGSYSELDTDNGDNGVYIVEGWDIVKREYFEGYEQDHKPLLQMLEEIDKSQPQEEQLGIEEIKKRLDKLNAPKF